MFASEARLWQTIAGHEPDPTRIPGREFEILVVIAQHGPQGVLQSVVTRLTGQDKHSVPARTDRLAKKGYIQKTSVSANRMRTSLLTLAKWAQNGPNAVLKDGMLHYDALFDATIALLKSNGKIMSLDDLCEGLNFKTKMNRKMLVNSCMRLSLSGCLRLLRCRVQDEDGNTLMLKHGKKERTARAIQLLREPTDDDKSEWVKFKSKLMTGQALKRQKSDSDEESEEDGEVGLESDQPEDDEDEDAEGETDDEGPMPQVSEFVSENDGEVEADDEDPVPPTANSTKEGDASTRMTSQLTPTRKSNRVRRKSSLAKTVDYAMLFEDEGEDSDGDADPEITDSASPGRRGTLDTARPMTPRPTKRQNRQRKATGDDSLNKENSVRRPRGRPRNVENRFEEADGFSMFATTPIEPSAAVVGTFMNPMRSTSSKRERKKSAKALEADALRAAGEPLLTEPVDGYDPNSDSDDTDSEARTTSERVQPANAIDGDDLTLVEIDSSVAQGTEKKARKPYKKREPAKRDAAGKKIREPIVKKREIPPEEYEEWEKYAQARAERQVRKEVKIGRKRSATMAELGDVTGQPSKVPRMAEQEERDDVEGVSQVQAADLPADRIAQVKASILARDKPGLYINPPGARNLKMENYVQRGRPRNAVIAVVSSDRLKNLPWFQDDGGPRFAPKASQRRTARIGHGVGKLVIDKSSFFVNGSGSEGEYEDARKKRRLGDGPYEGELNSSAETADMMRISQEERQDAFARPQFGLDGAADGDVPKDTSGIARENHAEGSSLRRTSRIMRRPSTGGFDFTPTPDFLSPSPPALAGSARADDEDQVTPPVESAAAGSPTAGMRTDPIAVAKSELQSLKRKRGRPRENDAIRIRVLERQIQVDAARRQNEANAFDLDSSAVEGDKITSNRDDVSGDSDNAASAQGTEATSRDDGQLQSPQHTMVLSVPAPPTFLGALAPAGESSAEKDAASGAAARNAQDEPAIATPATVSAQDGGNAKNASVPQQSKETALQPSMVSPTSAAGKLFTKQYVDDHPNEHFHHRGAGRWARGERSKAYMPDHPREKLSQARGKGNRVQVAQGPPVAEKVGRQREVESSNVTTAEAVSSKESSDPKVALSEQMNEPVSSQTQVDPELVKLNPASRDIMPMVEEQQQQAIEQATSPLTISREHPAKINAKQIQQVGMLEGSSQRHEDASPAHSGATDTTPIRLAKPASTVKTAKLPTTSTSWRRKQNADLDELFDKEYVDTHPGEHFYHRGRGRFSRGEVVSKEYAAAHPEQKFKTVSYGKLVREVPRVEPQSSAGAIAVNQELQSATSFNGTYELYDIDYVNSHPNETFHHRGGGRWHPGLPPPDSALKTAVRGPGAKIWKNRHSNPAAAQAFAAQAAAVSAAATPAIAAPTAKVSAAQTQAASSAATISAAAIPPVSSLLTIYRPYSQTMTPQTYQIPKSPTAGRGTETASTLVDPTHGFEKPVGVVIAQQPAEKDWLPASEPVGDIIVGEEEHRDQYVPPDQPDEETGDGAYVPTNEPEDDLSPGPGLEQRIHFPVDLTAAVIVRRTPQQKGPQANLDRGDQADSTLARHKRGDKKAAGVGTTQNSVGIKAPYRSRLQTVSKTGPSNIRKSAKSSRTPARGSKLSRDMHLQSQQAWPLSQASMPSEASALLMNPAQIFYQASGTFGTVHGTVALRGRALRDRTALAKLPQALDEDFCETPGLIVKLKVRNLASVLPANTAFESGLFAPTAATDAVPISKLAGHQKRAITRKPKKVTFQVDDSDSDEFRDDGEVEDDEENSDDFNESEDDTAVARPERRKRSTGVDGQLRIRDMASGPAFKDADRLVIAFALVAAVCGGLRVEGINWTLIAHALGFRYDGAFLRRRWDHCKRTRKVDVDRLREAIHEPFLAAYEDDDFPRVDFQNLNNTDWPALFDWVQATVVPYVQLQPKSEGPKVPDLLQSRQHVEERFEIKEPASLYEVRLDDYFTTPTEHNRRNLITRYTHGSAMPDELRPKDQVVKDMVLLRSWVRAVAVTKQYNYHPEAAAKKLRKFSSDRLAQVTAELVENRTFSQEKKSRMLPGRNYQISNECLQTFRRWPPRPDEARFLRFVAQAWKNINTHFQTQEKLTLVPSASDPEYLVLTNMAAQGMLRIDTVYPEIRNDYDAPFPKLSPWGYCGPTYETKRVDMTRLKFPIVYTKTAAYKDDHRLLNHVPIPIHPAQIEGEPGVRLPFWVDIHGNLIDDMWDMVLRSILHLLVFRAGTTASMIEQAHARKLWAWEIEMALEWMGEVGIAKRIGAGYLREDGVWSGGWSAGEWWYCAFAPEVARWQAPAVAELD